MEVEIKKGFIMKPSFKLAPRDGLDNFVWNKIGRTQCAQRVHTMEGVNQPPTY